MFDIIKILKNHLPKYKKILELSSKKGEDLEILHGFYDVVASENEKTKTRYLKDKFLDIRVILLDIVSMNSHKKFECIYSRNVLDNLSLEDMAFSLENQRNLLEGESLIFHIFDETKVSQSEIENVVNINYEIIDSSSKEGSFYILAKIK